jgi:hypothetical protein
MRATTQRKKDTARERRSEKRAIDVGIGRKKLSDAVIEEATEDAFDWLERGGFRRIWMAIRIIALIFIALIGAAVLFTLENAS